MLHINLKGCVFKYCWGGSPTEGQVCHQAQVSMCLTGLPSKADRQYYATSPFLLLLLLFAGVTLNCIKHCSDLPPDISISNVPACQERHLISFSHINTRETTSTQLPLQLISMITRLYFFSKITNYNKSVILANTGQKKIKKNLEASNTD